ncbi:VacJ family lipoprotein [Luteimonas sp. MC1828]|uniref:MlaA family lipoprotein n=1 Tax=Luteimonas sp. MC1828 TaxID=2799787 RepID=UPI0018F238AA|nr:VacJ family lipoprotein [Luteimonas sp. MC1828]MBJ7575423.1 VacJ family lipoprotein [Luteimonas sp. MC1828]
MTPAAKPVLHTSAVLLAALILAGCAGNPSRGVSEPAPGPVEAVPAQASVAVDGTPVALAVDDGLAPLPDGDVGVGGGDAGAAAPGIAAPAVDQRTDAELDYDAIWGAAPYDPVADATLPEPAKSPRALDPWEPWNRKVHSFNNVVDRAIATPLARAYVKVVPRPMRLGVSNFFNNLGQPSSAVNALLQGRPKQSGQSLGRFLVNATIGVGGLFDPATRMGIPNRSEDFGQTLGVWGWRSSRFLELPLFGPRTVRDAFGLVGDGPLSPVRQVEEDSVRVFLQGLQLVDVRTQLFAVDRLREGAADEYALVRDAWMQRRDYQIHGDRIREGDDNEDGLPDYLFEDDDATVPVDVMPIVPGTSTP